MDGVAEPAADGAGAQAQGGLSQDQVRVMKGPSINGARNQEQTTRVQNPRMRAVPITSLFLAAVPDLAESSETTFSTYVILHGKYYFQKIKEINNFLYLRFLIGKT